MLKQNKSILILANIILKDFLFTVIIFFIFRHDILL